MRDVHPIRAMLLTFGLAAISGCANVREMAKIQTYSASVQSRQWTELAMLSRGQLGQNVPLNDLDDWQPGLSSPATTTRSPIAVSLKDETTRTMVILTDAGSTERTSENDELYAKWGIDAARIRAEEMARHAFDLRIFQVYPDVGGGRRIEKHIVLPKASDLSEVSFKAGRSKYRVKWRPVFHDPYAPLYPVFVSGAYVSPTLHDFQRDAAEWTFRRGFKDTWFNVVSIATQYQGILSLQGREKEHTLICRRVVPVPDEKNESRFEVVMLAMVVVAESDSLTKVYCAPIGSDGKLQPLAPQSVLSFPREEIGSDFADSLNYLGGWRLRVTDYRHISPLPRTEGARRNKMMQPKTSAERQCVFIVSFRKQAVNSLLRKCSPGNTGTNPLPAPLITMTRPKWTSCHDAVCRNTFLRRQRVAGRWPPTTCI